MFDDITGQCLPDEKPEYYRLYVVVSPDDVVEASRLLSANRISHSVEAEAPNFKGMSQWPMPLPR